MGKAKGKGKGKGKGKAKRKGFWKRGGLDGPHWVFKNEDQEGYKTACNRSIEEHIQNMERRDTPLPFDDNLENHLIKMYNDFVNKTMYLHDMECCHRISIMKRKIKSFKRKCMMLKEYMHYHGYDS